MKGSSWTVNMSLQSIYLLINICNYLVKLYICSYCDVKYNLLSGQIIVLYSYIMKW